MKPLYMILTMIFLATSLSSAAEYYVEVQDGFGAGSQEDYQSAQNNNTTSTNNTNEGEDEDNQSNSTDPDKYIFNIENPIDFQDKVYVSMKNNSNNSGNSSDGTTSSDPIDWDPIILWSLIIVSILILFGVGWYFYQIYFY